MLFTSKYIPALQNYIQSFQLFAYCFPSHHRRMLLTAMFLSFFLFLFLLQLMVKPVEDAHAVHLQ